MIVMAPGTGEREIAAVGRASRSTSQPCVALCDGPQALYGSDFAAFATRVPAHASLDGRRIP
jgi:hypothetical protein